MAGIAAPPPEVSSARGILAIVANIVNNNGGKANPAIEWRRPREEDAR
jgi:hypothetical protein